VEYCTVSSGEVVLGGPASGLMVTPFSAPVERRRAVIAALPRRVSTVTAATTTRAALRRRAASHTAPAARTSRARVNQPA
jgi:hypothetical protein